MVEALETRSMMSISHTTIFFKHPGPTDTQINLATNPSGHTVPGQTSTTEVKNRDAK
jgi:hypothetical protein